MGLALAKKAGDGGHRPKCGWKPRLSDAAEHYRLGRELIDRDPESALGHLRTAHTVDPASPMHRAYYGLAIGLAERRFNKALELCQSAVKEEFFNPEAYCVLARLHVAFGFKAEAVRFFERAAHIDPGDAGIREQIRILGVRKRPVLGFLKRDHRLNRWFGRIRHRIEERTPVA